MVDMVKAAEGGGLFERNLTMPHCGELVSESARDNKTSRKEGLNRNKEGSVRNINGKIYVDFIYLNERVREPVGVKWNQKNAREVRERLNRIIAKISDGTFRYATVFPSSKKAKYFSEKEHTDLNIPKTPVQVNCGEFIEKWFAINRGAKRVAERTLLDYRSYIDLYLIPFFGKLSFGEINKITFDKFIKWAKDQKYRGYPVGNKSINKILVPFKLICKDASIQYGWMESYNPFFGFKKLLEHSDAYDKIFPFSIEEQAKVIEQLPNFWKPYFRFAFLTGISVGEQIALKPMDIDWQGKILSIRRAMSLDIDGNIIEGNCKNKHRRRQINLSDETLAVLKEQNQNYLQFKGTYFFCTSNGCRVNNNNLNGRVWTLALKKAGLEYRSMRQTRHSFATYHLSNGKNPLWIGHMMGHRDASMVLKTYAKYIGRRQFNGVDEK